LREIELNAKMTIEEQRKQVTTIELGTMSIDELLTIYQNYENAREKIRSHLHMRLMNKPHKMYLDTMRLMDNMDKC
jgi:hypothetical protein